MKCLLAATLIGLAGCQKSPDIFHSVQNAQPTQQSMDALMGNPVELPQGIQIQEISRSAGQSLHVVRIWTQEKPHKHVTHDGTVRLERGRGTFYLDGVGVPMAPGSWVTIPRGTPHYFVNETAGTYSQATVIFAPPFDGKDVVLLADQEGTGGGKLAATGAKSSPK